MTVAETGRIEDLIRILAELSAGSGDEGQPEIQVEEIILDMEVDGTRYLLIRLPKAAQPHAQISPREREIVRLVALGHSTKIIADVLNISSWTVCTHLRRIFAKLGVGSRAAMVARLSEIGRTRAPGLSGRGSSAREPAAPDQAAVGESRRLMPALEQCHALRRSANKL